MSAPHKDAWTDAELQIIYDHVNLQRAVPILIPLLPGRTSGAIFSKLDKLREEAGLKRRSPHRPGDARLDCATGSQRLAAAIERELSTPTPPIPTTKFSGDEVDECL